VEPGMGRASGKDTMARTSLIPPSEPPTSRRLTTAEVHAVSSNLARLSKSPDVVPLDALRPVGPVTVAPDVRSSPGLAAWNAASRRTWVTRMAIAVVASLVIHVVALASTPAAHSVAVADPSGPCHCDLEIVVQ